MKVVDLVREKGEVVGCDVDMGAPILERGQIPMTGPAGQVVDEPLAVDGTTLHVTGVSMGNPHVVAYVPSVAAAPVTTLGPRVEHHAAFPRRTNVHFVEVLSPREVRQRTWERGSGETHACGTGACAVSVAGVLTGRTGARAHAAPARRRPRGRMARGRPRLHDRPGRRGLRGRWPLGPAS